jgi:hypothetical protein
MKTYFTPDVGWLNPKWPTGDRQKAPSERPISELVGLPPVGTGSLLGRGVCGLLATPDAVALAMDPRTGAARLIITKPESAAVLVCDDESAKRPND